MNKNINVLIIEDEEAHVELISRAFIEYNQYSITFISTVAEAKKSIVDNLPDIIISDWKLPDGEGIELLSFIKDKYHCPFILMTSFGNQEIAVAAMKQGVLDYIVKSPHSINKLPFTVGRVLREWENMTARENAEKALRESELRYRALVETSQDAIFQVDLKGNYIFVNSAGCAALNTSQEEVKGKNISEFFPETYVKYQMESIKHVARSGSLLNLQMPLPFNGKIRELYVVLIPFFGVKNEIDSIVGICHDITDIKRTEKALKLSENKFKEQSELLSNILRHIPDYIYWKDTNSVYRGCNENFARSLGFDNPNKIIGKTDYDFYWGKEEADKITNEELKIMEIGFPLLNYEETKENLYREKRIISKSLIPLKDSEGNKAGIMGMYSDITDRKNSEEELRKLSRATEQSPSFIIITDTLGNIEYVNPSFEKITGYTNDEVKGKNPRFLKSGYTKKEIYAEMWKTIASGNDWRGEFQNRKKNGELYWEATSISSIKNEKGEITHYIAVKEDVTEKKELEFELKRAVDQAEESSRLKSSLLSNMSHELRTPLNGILGLSQILIEELASSSLTSFANKIYLAGKRLMITLNSILELSEIESNTTQIYKSEYDIGSNIKYLLTQYIYTAKERGLGFNIDIKEKGIVALVDERLCNQIFINLVDNALKYTEKGGITIVVDKEKEGDELFVKVSVIDTGIGIAESNIPIIFDDFRQVSEGYNRSFEGSGLGLTLVKKMLGLLKGKIIVESKLGIGSKFVVYLPGSIKESGRIFEDSLEGEDLIAEEKRQRTYRPEVLLVEDNAVNKEVITCYIDSFCNVDGVNDARSAIELASSKKYDIVLMDINLGNGMDGIEATKEIKKFQGYEEIPFIALTGYALSGDKERLLKEGLTHYLPKPFEKNELQKLIRDVLHH